MTAIVDWLNSSLGKIEHKVFHDIVEVEDANKEPVGDGQLVMISEIGRITLTLVNSKGEKKKLTAISKTEAKEGPGKDFAATCNAFTVEIKMYSDILKGMRKLMDEVGDEDYLWAECYHCGDNKLLIQDLCECGYKIVPLTKYLDAEHAMLTIKAIGKFHALSAVMKERNAFDSSDFKIPFYARQLPFMDAINKKAIGNLTTVMKEKWGSDWVPVADRLAKYLEKPGELVYNAWEASRGKWDVLNHGDFSIRNMLFHYPPGSNHPDGIKFVDFQMCHYSNSSNDLITLLYSSLKPAERDEHMDIFLESYVDSFRSTAKRHGYNGRLPTVKNVQESMESLTPVIVTYFTLSIPFFFAAGQEGAQEKSDAYFEKMKDVDDFNQVDVSNSTDEMDVYEDSNVKSYLQHELKKCIENNIL